MIQLKDGSHIVPIYNEQGCLIKSEHYNLTRIRT